MRQFYVLFSEQKWPLSAAKLSISHYDELLRFKDIDKIKYYIYICEKLKISRDELRKRIKNNEYERLDVNARNKIVNNKPIELIDTLKDPILIKNMYDKIEISERMLQKLILENIEECSKIGYETGKYIIPESFVNYVSSNYVSYLKTIYKNQLAY